MATEILDLYRQRLSPSYADYLERLDLACTVESAEGARIRDARSRTFVDFVAGYGVFNFGHNPPAVLEALRAALDGAPLWNRPFLHAPLAELADTLVGLVPAGLERAFVCSTGAEAIDSALKLARLTTRRPEIVAAHGGFHGYTLGALSVCGIAGQRKPFEPLLPGVRHVPFGDSAALAEVVSERTAAVVLEPVQAEVGAETPPAGYLSDARAICDDAGALLVIDEVRTGMGRTGPLWAIDDDHILPDILVIGKSLAGGIVPVAALLASGSLWHRFGLSFAMSASSFAGNRLACVASLATLKLLEDGAILAHGRRLGAALRATLDDLASTHPGAIERITGRGLLLGIHFRSAAVAGAVIQRTIQGGVLVAAAFCNPRCILLEPPLVLTREEALQGLDVLADACRTVGAEVAR